jgi:methionyl-tRNA formyltransferase
MKTVFFGTPEFAVASLESLAADSRFELVGVVTQPDRPVGRKKILTPPPAKIRAQALGLKVFQPEKLRDEAIAQILELKPELAVVVAYGNLIPKRLLEAVPRGFVNIHPSLLPKHRGASPLAATILSGDEATGVCLMVLDEAMDHGPVIACRPFPLEGHETTATLGEKLAPIGAEMLQQELADYLNGKISPKDQNHAEATFCKPIESRDARIDWSKSAVEIGRLVRAMNGVSPAWTVLGEQNILIHEVKPCRDSLPRQSGTIFQAGKDLAVACFGGYLAIGSLQPSGGKRMAGQAFLNGHQDILGKILA